MGNDNDYGIKYGDMIFEGPDIESALEIMEDR
jgi:hypothetical protein